MRATHPHLRVGRFISSCFSLESSEVNDYTHHRRSPRTAKGASSVPEAASCLPTAEEAAPASGATPREFFPIVVRKQACLILQRAVYSIILVPAPARVLRARQTPPSPSKALRVDVERRPTRLSRGASCASLLRSLVAHSSLQQPSFTKTDSRPAAAHWGTQCIYHGGCRRAAARAAGASGGA